MSKARDLANAGTALNAVTPTELGYLDGVSSAVQTQLNAKEATLPSQTGNSGKYLTTDGSSKSWGTVSQYALPSQTGNSGKYLTTNGTSESWASVTTPASLTLKRGRVATGEVFYDIETDGNATWVIVGANGILYSSTDSGSTWTSRTSQFGTSEIRSVVYGNGIWVAVGASGKISSSTDAITWTARTSGFGTNQIYAVNFVNGIFFAMGNDSAITRGGLSTSTDGATWTKRTVPAGCPFPGRSVAYGNGYYVIVGDNDTVSAMYSTDGASWTNTSNVTNNASHVVYANNQFISYSGYTNSDGWFTGNNPSTGWTTFKTQGFGNISLFVDERSIVNYNGNLYTYIRDDYNTRIEKQKCQVLGGYPAEIYQTPISSLPTYLNAVASKGDGTFGIVNYYGYVWFTSAL